MNPTDRHHLSSEPARGAWLGAARLALAGAALALLAACAAPITAKVTNFNAWPQDAAGATFSFGASDGKASELEQATYENYVGVELQRRGFRLAPPGQKGRFIVDVGAVGSEKQKTFLEPVYSNQFIWYPPYRHVPPYGSMSVQPSPFWGGYGYGYGDVVPGYWGPDGFGSRYVGDREVTRTVQVSRLQVKLFDTATPTPRPRAVFESTAVYEGGIEDLPDTVPFLVTAVFDGFPGQNGRVKVVKFDNSTGAIRR